MTTTVCGFSNDVILVDGDVLQYFRGKRNGLSGEDDCLAFSDGTVLMPWYDHGQGWHFSVAHKGRHYLRTEEATPFERYWSEQVVFDSGIEWCARVRCDEIICSYRERPEHDWSFHGVLPFSGSSYSSGCMDFGDLWGVGMARLAVGFSHSRQVAGMAFESRFGVCASVHLLRGHLVCSGLFEPVQKLLSVSRSKETAQ